MPFAAPTADDFVRGFENEADAREMLSALKARLDRFGLALHEDKTRLAVIAASTRAGLVSLPGIATPSEAFAALKAGATALKLFPAEAASPAVLKAMRAVLPSGVPILPVGGISPETMAPWLKAGAAGFGLGSALYSAGRSVDEVGESARAFVTAFRAART